MFKIYSARYFGAADRRAAGAARMIIIIIIIDRQCVRIPMSYNIPMCM